MNADFFCHVANTLFLASYAMTTQWKLRVISLTAQSVAMGYYITLALWAPMCWNIGFMTINVGRLIKLYRERKRCQDGSQALSQPPEYLTSG